MRDKKELLRQIMILLSQDDTAGANKLIKEFMDYTPEISSEEVTDEAQKLENEKVFADAQHHSKIEQKVFQIIKEKTAAKDLSDFTAGYPIHTFLEENVLIIELCQRANSLLEIENSFTELNTDWALIAKQVANLVSYYNPRSPGIVGRQIKYCHPSKSLIIVEKIVDAFKREEKDIANFWIDFQDKFICMHYFAVNDNVRNYKRELEITDDAKTVRTLEGGQRLLDWE